MSKKHHSSFWIPNRYFKIDRKRDTIPYVMMLGAVRRGVANFVRIVTGQNIPVTYSASGQSFTDGEFIVLNAIDDVSEVDSLVGIALHEAAHIKLSKALFYCTPRKAEVGKVGVSDRMKVWKPHMERLAKILVDRGIRTRCVQDDNAPSGYKARTDAILADVKLMINFLEDRRIDSWMYQNIGGYRPYYRAHYNKYFFTDLISDVLRDGYYTDPLTENIVDITVPTFRNYSFHIINMMNENFNPDALPGLREIYELANINNIDRFTQDEMDSFIDPNGAPAKNTTYSPRSLPPLMATAIDIVAVIYENVIEKKDCEQESEEEGNTKMESEGDDTGSDSGSGEDGENKEKENEEGGDSDKEEGENEGEGEGQGESTDTNPHPVDRFGWKGENPPPEDGDEYDKLVKKLADIVSGKMETKGLTEEEARNMADVEETDAEIRGASFSGRKCYTLVYRNVTPEIASREDFPFHNKWVLSMDGFTDGMKLGRSLSRRLKIIGEDRVTVYNRRKSGVVDKRRIAAIGVGDDDVFNRTKIEKYRPIFLDISLDSSGSMSFGGGNKWRNSWAISVAMAYVATRNDKIDVRISARTTTGDYGNEIPAIAILFDSRRDSMAKLRSLSRYIGPTHATPEGLCFETFLKEVIGETGDTRRYFLNISDGEPWAGVIPIGGGYIESYSGHEAASHTKAQINKIRNAGVHVMSYFVSENSGVVRKKLFDEMYGRDARYIDVTSVTGISRTLNELFLRMG